MAIKGGAENTHFKADGEKEHDTSFAFLMAFGVRVKSFRAEFEWANISRNRLKHGPKERTSYDQQRYMAQFYYDFPLRSAFRPYLNVGAGAAYTDVSYRYYNTHDTDNDTTVAWNAGAGLGINVTRAWSFDLGYRYVDSGKLKAFDDATVKVRSHEGYMGIRYTF